MLESSPTKSILDGEMRFFAFLAKKIKPLRGSLGGHLIALADQAVVSLASFLAMIAVSRWVDPGQLGIYSIGTSIVVILLGVQAGLISLPYTIQQHSALGTASERAGSALAQSAGLSVASAILLAGAALTVNESPANSGLSKVLWVLAFAAPFLLLREFGRQFSFARLRMAEAFALDAAVTIIQLAALVCLGPLGRISPATACAALGCACAVIGVPWLYFVRDQFEINRTAARITKQGWELAKWLFAAQITALLQRYVTYWLLAIVAGSAATGVFAACMSIVTFANPLIIGLSNLFMPKAVLAFTTGGARPLMRQILRDSLVLAAVMIPFTAAVALNGEQIMRLLYHGADYRSHGSTVTLLALAWLLFASGVPAAIGLASMERPVVIVWAGLFGVAITVGLVPKFAGWWGLTGAAWAVLAGSGAEAAMRWIGFSVEWSRRLKEPATRETPSAEREKDSSACVTQ
jgi:O-antigen/teichoic acid export membrane protein